jgi:hypothetical protein
MKSLHILFRTGNKLIAGVPERVHIPREEDPPGGGEPVGGYNPLPDVGLEVKGELSEYAQEDLSGEGLVEVPEDGGDDGENFEEFAGIGYRGRTEFFAVFGAEGGPMETGLEGLQGRYRFVYGRNSSKTSFLTCDWISPSARSFRVWNCWHTTSNGVPSSDAVAIEGDNLLASSATKYPPTGSSFLTLSIISA